MSSIVQSFQKRSFLPNMPTISNLNGSLPVSQSKQDPKDKDENPGIRRRLSSLSLKIHPTSSSCSSSSPVASWAFRRSKSVSSMGEYAGSSIRKWWDWGWSWILSKKPIFAEDLEMNEEETKLLGSHNRGSWRHVFFKVRSELKRFVGSDRVGLPQTCRYDSFNYSKNFDDGTKTHLVHCN